MEQVEHDGITYKFELLTIGQEEEWRDWVRQTKIDEAMKSSEGWPLELRAAVLANISKSTPLDQCTFLGDIGRTVMGSESGVVKILQFGAKKHHPEIPVETIKNLAEAKPIECARVMLTILPVSEQARTKMLGELEKKVAGGLMDGLS